MGRMHTHRHGKSHSIRPATLRAPSWITLTPTEIEALVVKYAKDDCLVMLGVSPKNPILKYFFGSKPISIAQQCNCPVLIAK